MFFYMQLLPVTPQPVAKLTVKTQVLESPVRKRVSIVDRLTQELLWHSFVEADGEITRILPLKYSGSDYLCVTAYDDTGTYNAVVADNVQSELVP